MPREIIIEVKNYPWEYVYQEHPEIFCPKCGTKNIWGTDRNDEAAGDRYICAACHFEIYTKYFCFLGTGDLSEADKRFLEALKNK